MKFHINLSSLQEILFLNNLFKIKKRDSDIYIEFEVTVVLFNPQYILNTVRLILCYINEIF